MSDLEILRRKLFYRATHRGTREADIVIGNYVRRLLSHISYPEARKLEIWLEQSDDTLLSLEIFYRIEDSFIKTPPPSIVLKW
jgi:succinate dehydrogenase flavin-adding protein (antitoxin of CptAB toxin-antitoxin module)